MKVFHTNFSLRTLSRHRLNRLCLLLACSTLLACNKNSPPATIVVPSAATSAAEYRGDGSIPTQRYVVRMSDGARDWEIEFPEVATGYEVRIPLKDERLAVQSESQPLTAADKQLLEHLRRVNPEVERAGIYNHDRNVLDNLAPPPATHLEPGAELDDEGQTIASPGHVNPMGGIESKPAPTRPSYFLGVEEIQMLFRQGNHELAMVKLVNLEQAYPNDVKLLSMKGTLWLKLGRQELARDAWEQVLQIDPQNRAVVDALKNLNHNYQMNGQ